jgi:CheY-like chemotaxis protein
LENRQAEILLIEDSLPDVRLTERALKKSTLAKQVSVVRDGEQALAFLRRQGEYANAPRPDIILLDLGLPKKNGAEVLAEIKKDPALKRIPVIVLTSSDAEEDVLDTYNHHANAYTKKPVDMDEFVRTIKMIEDFWLSLVILPRREI